MCVSEPLVWCGMMFPVHCYQNEIINIFMELQAKDESTGSAITSLKDPILLNIRPNRGPNSHMKSDLYQTWDPKKSDLSKNQRFVKVVLKIFPLYIQFWAFFLVYCNWKPSIILINCINSFTKKDIKSKWNRLFGLCVVLKVQKRTKADFFKQKQTHFRG